MIFNTNSHHQPDDPNNGSTGTTSSQSYLREYLPSSYASGQGSRHYRRHPANANVQEGDLIPPSQQSLMPVPVAKSYPFSTYPHIDGDYEGDDDPTAPDSFFAEQAYASSSPKRARSKSRLERLLHHYTHRLGLNFNAVLGLAITFQLFIVGFIALNGIRAIPLALFSPTNNVNDMQTLLGNLIALCLTAIIQGLIIAELAQVVWLRQPDRLKVRLMSSSAWWWVMLVALVITVFIDFLLLFFSVTGKVSLAEAWNAITRNQATGAVTGLLTILNFLTMLRCAAVMRTATSREIHQEVEERLAAIAEEILIDAGDEARTKTAQVWQELAISPMSMVPVFASVMGMVARQHPSLMPMVNQLGDYNNWSYDFTSNTFVFLPGEVHRALLSNQRRIQQRYAGKPLIETDSDALPWRLPSAELAELISFRMDEAGQPNFVNATNPSHLRPFITSRSRSHSQGQVEDEGHNHDEAEAEEGSIPDKLTPAQIVLFGAYLSKKVFPTIHGKSWPNTPEVSIFEVFEGWELKKYYLEWQSSLNHAAYAPNGDRGGKVVRKQRNELNQTATTTPPTKARRRPVPPPATRRPDATSTSSPATSSPAASPLLKPRPRPQNASLGADVGDDVPIRHNGRSVVGKGSSGDNLFYKDEHQVEVNAEGEGGKGSSGDNLFYKS